MWNLCLHFSFHSLNWILDDLQDAKLVLLYQLFGHIFPDSLYSPENSMISWLNSSLLTVVISWNTGSLSGRALARLRISLNRSAACVSTWENLSKSFLNKYALKIFKIFKNFQTTYSYFYFEEVYLCQY